MATWIALFRGINVGGNNILPMAELRQGLQSIGLENPRTYIQSGNCVFESSVRSAKSLGTQISELIEQQRGFRPSVLALKASDLQNAIDANPFPKATEAPKTLHFSFLESKPKKPDLDGLAAIQAAKERWQLIDKVFYLHAPDGIARSKLAQRAEKLLGVTATARNYNTVAKLVTMCEA